MEINNFRLELMPKEILWKIAENLSITNIINCLFVSKILNKSLIQDTFWKYLAKRNKIRLLEKENPKIVTIKWLRIIDRSEKKDVDACSVYANAIISSKRFINPSYQLAADMLKFVKEQINEQHNFSKLLVQASQNPKISLNKGIDYFYGHRVDQSDIKAFLLFTIAAEQGIADAQYNIGLMYQLGQGKEKSFIQAKNWYQKAANQGQAESQHNLGTMYYNGDGVKKSYSCAKDYFQKAADQGHAESQFNLGVMYYEGNGGEQSYSSALKWFSKAADQGHQEAKQAVSVIQDSIASNSDKIKV